MSDDRVSGRLTATEAAARLGVKRQTLYAYVSRGVLPREVAPDGRTSLFDPSDLDRLRQGRRPETEGELHTVMASGLTLVDDRGLWIRGRSLVGMIGDGATFLDVVDHLWDSPPGEGWPDTTGVDTGDRAPEPSDGAPISLLDELRIITARCSSADALRHELSGRSVRAAGRTLIPALAAGLASPTGDQNTEDRNTEDRTARIVGGLWRRLTTEEPTPERLGSLDAAMSLLVDHGLAASTLAARIAASVRADPYSVVTAGLGVIGGTMHGAASGAVHALLAEAERSGDAIAAAGATRRRIGAFPGFGHQVYRIQDPRYGELMSRIIDAWGGDPRLVTVYRVRDVIGERTDAIPNVDLALGALSYLARMPEDAGEAIFAIARTAGWLAHALEEYEEQPLRFRPRGRYVGPRPAEA